MKKSKHIMLIVTILVLLLNCISIPVHAYDLSQRKFTDEQINSILNDTPEKLRTEISTVADAESFLNKKFPSLWMSYHMWQGQNSNTAILRSATNVLSSANAGRSDMATAMTYLLSDDMNIGSIYGFNHNTSNSITPIIEANYIFINGQYDIFDPVIGMDSDKISRHIILPNATVSTFDDYAKIITNDSSLSNTIDSLYTIKDGQQITFVDKNSWTTITQPSVQPFYANKSISDNKYANIIPENIDKYKLSKILGGTTLSIADAKSLVGQSPQVIKDKVKTAGDLLMYMLAAKLELKDGDIKTDDNGHQWHYNATADVTLSENLGNCGRMANLANYLLEGDYEEVGFILHSYTGNNGGHVYNYIKYQGKYYIVDFSSYLFNNYNVNSEFNFISMDNLMDYSTRWRECYGGVAEIIAHTSKGTHLPNVWEGNYCYYPDNSKFTVIMQTPECQVSTLLYSINLPDWKKPQIVGYGSQVPDSKPEPTNNVLTADQLYTNAFNATQTAKSTGKQKDINNARIAISALKETNAAWAIGEFSKQVDQLQQPILVNIIDDIIIAKINPYQANVNVAKAAIDNDLPLEWKNAYSSAVDEIEQELINDAINDYNIAVNSKSAIDIINAKNKINDIMTSTDINIVNWIKDYKTKIDSLVAI